MAAMYRNTSSALERFLSVPELLELLLAQLDMPTLLVSAQRVSRSWNAFIAQSPRLQQILHFQPVEEPFPLHCRWDPLHGTQKNGHPALNPILVDKFGDCFFDPGAYHLGHSYGLFRRAESFYAMRWTAKPYVTIPVDYGSDMRPQHMLEIPSDLDDNDMAKASKDMRRFTRRGASWRRMLVSQPPPPSVGFFWWEPDEDDSFRMMEPERVREAVIPSLTGDGLRMGQIYDLVQHHAGHHDRNSLWFRVTWGKPQPPWMTEVFRRECIKLLNQTSVLIELRHEDDAHWVDRPRDPPDLSEFEAHFRCDEHNVEDFDYEEPLLRNNWANDVGFLADVAWSGAPNPPAVKGSAHLTDFHPDWRRWYELRQRQLTGHGLEIYGYHANSFG